MSYTVTFKPSGHKIQVDSEESILDSALRQGFEIPYRCRNGDCGTCKALMTKGRVSQPDDALPALKGLKSDEILLCSSKALSDVSVVKEGVLAPGEIPPSTYQCDIAELVPLCPGVLKVLLRHNAFPELKFMAGQYLNLLIDGEERSFSIASAPENETCLELHIRVIDAHPVNERLVQYLSNEDQVDVVLPFGKAVLQSGAERPLLMVAGGTGFAPMKSLIESALANNLQRPITLYWGATKEPLLYYTDLVRRWARHVSFFEFKPVLSEPDPDWCGEQGLVHECVLRDIEHLDRYDVYLSGSMPMVDTAYKAFESAGLPRAQLFSDMADIIDMNKE